MGLKETLSSKSTLQSSRSNNIDVHLQKNTEYGAMLILAVSDYGKQGNGTTGSDYISKSTYGLATTTGNVSGIYNLGERYEWVAAGAKEAFSSSFNTLSGANGNIFRYYANLYTTTETGKVGDAMLETPQWQASSGASWITSHNPGFLRGNGGAFSYNDSGVTYSHRARAVVVCRKWILMSF